MLVHCQLNSCACELIYVEEGRQCFHPSVLRCMSSKKICLAGFMYLGGSKLSYNGESQVGGWGLAKTKLQRKLNSPFTLTISEGATSMLLSGRTTESRQKHYPDLYIDLLIWSFLLWGKKTALLAYFSVLPYCSLLWYSYAKCIKLGRSAAVF